MPTSAGSKEVKGSPRGLRREEVGEVGGKEENYIAARLSCKGLPVPFSDLLLPQNVLPVCINCVYTNKECYMYMYKYMCIYYFSDSFLL